MTEKSTLAASRRLDHRPLGAESDHLNSYCPEPVRGAILAAKPSVNGGLRQMTRFEIPTLTTDRLLLRAFRAHDLDAFAAMRANPEVVRYLGTGRPSTPVDVWRMMAGFLGQWALLGYGVWACEKIEAARLSAASAFSIRSTGRNRKSFIRSTDPFDGRALRPKPRRRLVIGCSSTSHWPGLRASFGPTISHQNESQSGSERFTSAHPSRVVPPMSVGCITAVKTCHGAKGKFLNVCEAQSF